MFSQFQSIFKKQAQKLTQKVQNFDLLGVTSSTPQQSTSDDYSKTPQKFNINGRQIHERRLLAEGAFGFIWIAEDASTREEFALKRVICMTEENVRSALIEKSIMEKLPESPYIVKYYGGTTFKHEGNTVVVTLMQHCPGGNLFDLLQKRQGKGIPEQTVKQIASCVLSALSVMHKAGFIHRDIKIQNILIGKDKRMKICDFGSCTTEVIDFSQIPKSQYEITKERMQKFTTPMYRPPQIVDPYLRYKVSGKADLWMLGCVLYTMSYFIHPFLDANAVGISSATFRFPKPNQTPYKVTPKMQDYIRNLLTPNPEHRPSADKMLELLNKWQDLTSMPLNQDAKRLKKEHEEKELEMEKLSQKVSKYDGDIPLEELMKLQNKLKNSNQESYQKQRITFITNKQTQILSSTTSKPLPQPQPLPQPHPKPSKPLTAPSTTLNPSFDQFPSFPTPAPTNQQSHLNKKPSAPVTVSASKAPDFDAFNQVFKDIGSGKKAYVATSGHGAEVSKVGGSGGNKVVSSSPDFYQFFSSVSSGSGSQPKEQKSGTANNNTSIDNSNSKNNSTNLLDL